MTDVVMETYCEACGDVPHSLTDHCPSCGAEDPWVDKPKYDMDTVDFPVVLEREHYDDDYGLWRDFTSQVFGQYELRSSQIANVPDDFPRMKYCVPTTYWVVFEDRVEGPFADSESAYNAIDGDNL